MRGLGANWQKIGNYRSIITAFLNVAETTQPGTAARERIIRDIMRCQQQPVSTRLTSATSRSWSSPSATSGPENTRCLLHLTHDVTTALGAALLVTAGLSSSSLTASGRGHYCLDQRPMRHPPGSRKYA